VPFEDVLAAARAGASWACADIWRTFSGPVAGYLRSRGSRETEDLTNEVFLAVFSKLPGFVGDERAFRSFVFTIAHRRLVDELRSRSRRPTDVEWEDDVDPRRSGSAEEQAMHVIGDSDARSLLEGLAPDQRDVLVLRIFGDLTVEQVAEILGKRPGAVKALQRRGLQALRKKVPHGRTPVAVGNDGVE
jgi:RNA polymerase sigma factor (sigma-70 family)